jgi:hypothetical protein
MQSCNFDFPKLTLTSDVALPKGKSGPQIGREVVSREMQLCSTAVNLTQLLGLVKPHEMFTGLQVASAAKTTIQHF